MNCYSPTPARREHESDCDGPRPVNIEALIDHVRESPNSAALAIREWFAGNAAHSAEPDQPVALSTLTDEQLAFAAEQGYDDYWTEDSKGIQAEAWTASAKAVLSVAASAQVQPVGEDGDRLIALAEKCSAEVGRYEGNVVWLKFHSRSSVEAFAAGIVMSAAVRVHAAASAPAQQAGQGWKLVPIEPTEEMKAAPRRDRAGFSGNVAREVYQSMLAASPAHEQAPPPQPVAAEVAKDAERYRWLREQNWDSSMLCVVRDPIKNLRLGADCPSLIRLDEFIDAALCGTGSDESAKENGNG